MPTVSGSEHLCAFHSPKVRSSQTLRTPMKIADTLRLCALFLHSTRQRRGASQALCTPTMKIADSLRLCALFGAVHSPKLRGVAGSVHPHDENCRRPQALCSPLHENSGASQALCTPVMKSPTVSGSELFLVHSTHENCGTSEALCTPMMKIADSLRLCAPPRAKIGGRRRLCAAPW